MHKLDPRLKLILTLGFVTVLFIGTNIASLTVAVVFLIILYRLAKIPFRVIIKSIKPILPLIIFTMTLNMFFAPGDVLFRFYFLTITKQGIEFAVTMTVRIICLIVGSSLLTYTTSPISLTGAIEAVLAPLKLLRFPVHELAMMMTIALRSIPILLLETEKIMNAQKARGAQLDEGNIVQRVKAMIPVLVPLFVSAFRSADELATAMESRCYNGGEGRTRLHSLKFEKSDYIYGITATVILLSIGAVGILW